MVASVQPPTPPQRNPFSEVFLLLLCPGDEYVSSGLSEHSSDRLQPSFKPHQAPLTSKEAESEVTDSIGDSGSELFTPASESNLADGKPITLQKSVDAVAADTREQVCVS